jgi:two-component system, NarL family, response regulator DevR
MPGLSGIDACRQIVQSVDGCRVIMLTSYAEDELLFSAIQAGASGYVLKRIGDNQLSTPSSASAMVRGCLTLP